MAAERIKVFVRIRPSVDDQKQDSSDDLSTNFEYDATKNEFRMKKKIYAIDGILAPNTQQSEVYHRVATDQINAFLQGFNTTIFAYGQTGSGKTHTIFGPDMSLHSFESHSLQSTPTKSQLNPKNSDKNISNIRSLFGLVPRCFINIFETLQSSNHIKKHQMDISCVEVYNTTLRDLFQPSNSKNLKIREDIKSKKFFVEHLREERIQTCEELLLFIKRIQLNRAVSSTNMNQTSSRSHVLLQLRVIQQLLTGETKESLFTFVDLAGSEMVKKTGTKGDTLKEAGYINSSLSTLSRCIEGLGLQHSNKNKKIGHNHIPFRDSSLTKLLKTALGGNCKTTLVVCVSTQFIHKEETLSSLRFATRAACIKNIPVINKALDAQALYDENIKLKAEIQRLQAIVSGDKNQWLEQKLNDLEEKEQEIIDLKQMIEELQLKLDKTTGDGNTEKLSEIQDENVKLSQTINELEIQLMRERHSKDVATEKLVDMQVIYSEVASQRLFDDYSEVEIEHYKRRSSVDVKLYEYF